MKHVAIAALAALSWLSFPASASADFLAYTCRATSHGSGSIKAVHGPGGCVGYVVTDGSGQVRQRGRLGFGGSGELLLAPDGKTVVFLQSYPFASLTRSGTFQQYGHPRGATLPPLVGVAIYRHGKLIAKHSTVDLLVRPRMVTLSTSHFRWFTRAPALTRTGLSLATTSMREVHIDLRTGALSARDSAQWTACTAIAYGQIRRLGRNYEMRPAYWAKGGSGKSKVRFSAISKLNVPLGYNTVCLTRSNKRWRVRRVTRGPMLNGLTI